MALHIKECKKLSDLVALNKVTLIGCNDDTKQQTFIGLPNGCRYEIKTDLSGIYCHFPYNSFIEIDNVVYIFDDGKIKNVCFIDAANFEY